MHAHLLGVAAVTNCDVCWCAAVGVDSVVVHLQGMGADSEVAHTQQVTWRMGESTVSSSAIIPGCCARMRAHACRADHHILYQLFELTHSSSRDFVCIKPLDTLVS